MPITKSATRAGSIFTVYIKVNEVKDLFGIAFGLQYTNPRNVNVLSVDKGNFLGDDVLFYSHIDKQNGLVSIGISRKHPESGVNDGGIIAKITFKSRPDVSAGTVTNFAIKEVTANDSSGNGILFRTPALPGGTPVVLNPMPETPQLLQNFPNPFNPETWIPFELSSPAEVIISIYSVSGKLVKIINLGYKPSGLYTSKEMSAYWDGRNSGGEIVSSGVYLYTIQAGNFSATKKMLVVR
jgi:hypothetical protein